MRTLRGFLILSLCLPLGALLAAPLLADDVYLKNGRSFDGVVAEVGDSQVRVHMPGGVISLPLSFVDHVQKADSAFAEYQRRKARIVESESRGDNGQRAPRDARRAEDWLDLARWAQRNNLPQGAREAALTAAQIDPRQPGLAALLRGFGYVYEESLDRWIPYADSMRLHGFVQEGGTWVSREEHAERVAQERESQAALAAQEAAAAGAQADLLRAQIQLGQQAAGYGYGNGGGYYGDGSTLGGFYGPLWPFTSSVFSVPGFGLNARGFGRFGHRGFAHERHEARERRELRRPGGPGARSAFTRPSLPVHPPIHR
jgi:hypothetical protein